MRGRTGTRYDELYGLAAPIEPDEGHSNYFNAPQEGLDDRLFLAGSETMKPEIRTGLLDVLYSFWETRYEAPEAWSEAWVAGSAVSRTWSRDASGKGDLDVLIGIDMPVFFQHNPSMKSFPETVIARHMNAEFREHLWPMMADYRGEWEVTFYVNPTTGRDISSINPYAAYNLKTDVFDVQPIELPEDWGKESVHPSWWDAVDEEIERARILISRYNKLSEQLGRTSEGPQRVNVARELGLVIDQATALFEEIHGERRHAFQGQFGVQGEGYVDYFNFRWQAHKRAGTGPTLADIRRVGRATAESQDVARYGAPVARDVLTPSNLLGDAR